MGTSSSGPSPILRELLNLVASGALNQALIDQGFNGSGAPPSSLSDGTVTVVQAAASNKLGLYGATPVVKQAIAGTTLPATMASLLAKLVLVGLATNGATFTAASIVGTTAQEQIDSIVAGLVALGLAVDNRP